MDMISEQNWKVSSPDVDVIRHEECLRVSDRGTDKVEDLSDDQLTRLETDLLGKEEHLEREEIEDEIPF